MTDFGNTLRGAKFFDADIPRLIRAIERVGDELEKANSEESAIPNGDISVQMMQLATNGHPAPWAVFEKDDVLLGKADEDDDFLEAFLETLSKEMESDGDAFKDIRKLLGSYQQTTDEYRAVMDAVFCALCGWSIPTLLKKAADDKEV